MSLRRLFRRRPAPTATFSPTGITDGTRWLVCDTTVCAHLTTRHTPTSTGWECTRCHTTKGDQ
ncbi:hypothetical protein ACFV97_02595 [Streptomyces sp. NPDC059913]|uniref:hypothetical protein n=1 Tax=unclassified Streptomyces TaxID=2593676 RepID=UPI003667D0DE